MTTGIPRIDPFTRRNVAAWLEIRALNYDADAREYIACRDAMGSPDGRESGEWWALHRRGCTAMELAAECRWVAAVCVGEGL